MSTEDYAGPVPSKKPKLLSKQFPSNEDTSGVTEWINSNDINVVSICHTQRWIVFYYG